MSDSPFSYRAPPPTLVPLSHPLTRALFACPLPLLPTPHGASTLHTPLLPFPPSQQPWLLACAPFYPYSHPSRFFCCIALAPAPLAHISCHDDGRTHVSHSTDSPTCPLQPLRLPASSGGTASTPWRAPHNLTLCRGAAHPINPPAAHSHVAFSLHLRTRTARECALPSALFRARAQGIGGARVVLGQRPRSQLANPRPLPRAPHRSPFLFAIIVSTFCCVHEPRVALGQSLARLKPQSISLRPAHRHALRCPKAPHAMPSSSPHSPP